MFAEQLTKITQLITSVSILIKRPQSSKKRGRVYSGVSFVPDYVFRVTGGRDAPELGPWPENTKQTPSRSPNTQRRRANSTSTTNSKRFHHWRQI